MYDVWDNVLKDNSTLCPIDQQKDLAKSKDVKVTKPQLTFIRTMSVLSPVAFTELHGVVQNMSGPLARFTEKALTTTRPLTKTLVKVGLVTVFLAAEIRMNIKKWWNGEISGKRCVKNIIDKGASLAAGLCGVMAGETVGALLGVPLGPPGVAVGALVGGLVGGLILTEFANEVVDLLTRCLFGLPQSEALENAYNFLEITPEASNSDINSKYRHLSLKYHPDKGGKRDDWTRLQYSMAVIKEARGEA